MTSLVSGLYIFFSKNKKVSSLCLNPICWAQSGWVSGEGGVVGPWLVVCATHYRDWWYLSGRLHEAASQRDLSSERNDPRICTVQVCFVSTQTQTLFFFYMYSMVHSISHQYINNFFINTLIEYYTFYLEYHSFLMAIS